MRERPEPIYSTHENAPDLEEAISDFVIKLAERIDVLQDVHSVGDLGKLDSLSTTLAADARNFGYDDLADQALAVSEACAEGKADAAESGLVEMGELSRRIRRAHRGAA